MSLIFSDGRGIKSAKENGYLNKTTKKRPGSPVEHKEDCMGAFLLRCAEVAVGTAISFVVLLVMEDVFKDAARPGAK